MAGSVVEHSVMKLKGKDMILGQATILCSNISLVIADSGGTVVSYLQRMDVYCCPIEESLFSVPLC